MKICKIATVAAALTMLCCMTGCNNKEEKSGQGLEEMKSIEVPDELVAENFAQIDENGNVFILNKDGTKDILTENGEFVNEKDLEKQKEEKLSKTFVGTYTGNNFSLNIMNNWHGIAIGENIKFSPDNTDDSTNYIMITTFDNAMVTDPDVFTQESLTADFEGAVKNEVYSDFEFVSCGNKTVGGADALEYKAKIKTLDDKLINYTTYVVKDNFGGHLIAISDEEDDILIDTGVESFLNKIEFCETSTESEQETETTDSTDVDKTTDSSNADSSETTSVSDSFFEEDFEIDFEE